MALIVTFVNDGRGSDESASYVVRVAVNRREIASGRVTGHRRSDPWWVLVRKLLELAPASDAVDPQVASQHRPSTRDSI